MTRPDPARLSLNTATIREKWGLAQAIEGCARHGIRGIDRRAIEEAHALGAQCLVLVVGGLPVGSKDLPAARNQVKDGIAEILPEARQAGVPLAIEPLHPVQAAERACVDSLQQALDLCDALGEGIGVAVDVYHVWWEPKLEEQIARAGYAGFHEVEIFSKLDRWQRDPDEVLATCKDRYVKAS